MILLALRQLIYLLVLARGLSMHISLHLST